MDRLRRLSSGAKVTVAFGMTFLLALVVGVVSWISALRLAADLDSITGNRLPTYRHVTAAYAAQNDIQASLNGLATERVPERRRDLEEDVDRQLVSVEREVRAYLALPHGDEQERRWGELRVFLSQWLETARAQRALEAERDRLLAAGESGDLRPRTMDGLHQLREFDHVTDEAFLRLVDQMNKDADADREGAMAAIAAVKRTLIGVVIICGALTASLAYAAARGVKRNEEARRAELEKALLARRLELIARYGSDILILCDRRGCIVEANERAVATHASSREEILSLNVSDLFSGPGGDILERFQGAAAQGVVFEALARRKDGSTFPVELSSALIEVEGAQFCLGVARDITERKRAEDQRAFQLTLLDTLHDAVIGVDTTLHVRSWNKAAEQLYGWRAEEVLGRNIDDVLGCACGTGAAHDLRALQVPGAGTHMCGEFVQRRRDGATVEVQGEASAIRDADGRITGYLLANRDVAERRRAEEADAANRAKSRFLASMSHEIRTPLNAILGYAQIMVRDPALAAGARRNLAIINRSGEHLLALINDILEMSKIEAGRVVATPVTFDLHGMLNDLESMFRLRASAKRLAFRVVKAQDVPCVIFADEGKVRQVLVNLLGNAVKFTARGSVTLRVSSARRATGGLTVVAEVEDTGVGIAADELGKLFQHFGQTESGRQAQSGTGLGLAISREHARLMGGDIRVSSESGKGSLFTFEFAAEEGSADARSAGPRGRVTGLQIAGPAPRALIVDDQEANRDWLGQLLVTIGFDVREVATGEEAVATWRAWRPELVLMDMRMPGMDGHEATRRIRREPGGEKTAILALTASVFAGDREEVLRSGADEFIGKPVREAELLEKIRAKLGLEYLYSDAEPAAGSTGVPRPAVAPLAPDALAAVPRAALSAMRAATTSGDIDRLRSLLGEVERSAGPAAAGALRALADGYDYEGLHHALGSRESST